jgi:hypothetical protein
VSRREYGLLQITAEEMRRVFRYEPATGVLSWSINRARMAMAGSRAGYLKNCGRRMVKINGRLVQEHRLIWLIVTGEWPKGVIDHINGNPADNRFANLRDVSQRVNVQNQRRGVGRSGLLGVGWHGQLKKWQVCIRDSTGRQHYLGVYADKEEASRVYLAAKREMHEGCTI